MWKKEELGTVLRRAWDFGWERELSKDKSSLLENGMKIRTEAGEFKVCGCDNRDSQGSLKQGGKNAVSVRAV